MRKISKLQQNYNNLKRKAKTLNKLFKAGISITSSLDLKQLMIRVLESAVTLTNADESALYLIDSSTKELFKRAKKLHKKKNLELLKEKVNNKIIDAVFEQNIAIRQNTINSTSFEFGNCFICAPLNSKCNTLGALSVHHHHAGKFFTKEDENSLTAIATYAANAIENLNLLQESEQRARVLSGLHRVSQSLLYVYNLHVLLETIADKACTILGADLVVLYEYIKQNDDVRLPPIIKGVPKKPEILNEVGRVVPHKKSVVFKMLYRNKPVYAPDARNDWIKAGLIDPRQKNMRNSFILREDISSSAAIPLQTEDEAVGVLFINYRNTCEFTLDLKEKIEIFANQAALAIRNARRMDQERQLRQKAEILQRVTGTISSKIELEELAGEILDEMAKVVEYKKATIQLFKGGYRELLAYRGFEKEKIDYGLLRPISQDRLIKQIVDNKVLLILEDPLKHPDWEKHRYTADVKSWVGLPLLYAGEVIGLMTLDHHQKGFYKQEIKQLLIPFVNQVSNAIKNARLFKDAQRRIQDLEIINESAQIIGTKLDTKSLIQTIIHQIAKNLDCSHCTFFAPEKQNGQVLLIPQVSHGLYSKRILTRHFKPGEGLAGWVFEHGESLLVNNVQEEQRFAPSRVKKETPRSMLIVPVKAGNSIVGVISADQDKINHFNENDQRLVETLAIHTGVLFERVKGSKLLQEISIQIISTDDEDVILKQIISGAIDLTNATSGIIFLIGKDGKSIIKRYPYPLDSEHPTPRMNKKSSITRQVIRSGKIISISDMTKERRVNPLLLKNFRAMIAVPLKIEKKVIGVLFLNDRQIRHFNETESSLLATLADQAAIAIIKAQIFCKAKKQFNELSALYDTSKQIAERSLNVKKVLKAIVKRAVELTSAQGGAIFLCDQARQEVKIVVSHNLDALIGLRLKFGEGMAGKVAKFGHAMIQNAYHSWEGRSSFFEKEDYKNLFNAVIQVPLKWNHEVIGVLAISDIAPGRIFAKDEVRLLERFAGPAAIAINNARIYGFLQTLIKSSPDAIVAIDTKGIIKEFNEGSERIIGYRKNEILDKSVVDLYWDGLEEAKRINFLLHKNKNTKIRGKETLLKSKRGEQIPIRFAGSLLYDEKGESIGSVGHLEDLREIRVIEERYHALYEVSKIAVEIPESDFKKICKGIMDVLTEKVLHFKASFLYMVNNEELEIMATGGLATAFSPPVLILKRGESVTGQILNMRKSLYIKNIQRKKKFKYRDWVRKNSIHSYLGVPLIIKNDIIGIITVYTGEEYVFSKEEIEFLERFASLSALVIDKAKEMIRIRNIADVLSEVTPHVVDMSGEDIYGDLWQKIKLTIARMIPNTNVGLYICDKSEPGVARRKECSSNDLRSRLKPIWHTGEIPFITEAYANSKTYVCQEVRNAQGRLEGFLILERKTNIEGKIKNFDEIDRLVFANLASAVGNALFIQRKSIIRTDQDVIK